MLRTSRPLALGVSAALAAAGLALAIPTTASAATPTPVVSFGGTAYGSSVSLPPLSSGQTAAVSVCSTTANKTVTNNAAQVDLGLAGKIGAVTTSIKTAKSGTDASSVAAAQTAGFNLLGGLVQATALTTTATAASSASGYTTSGSAVFANLKIAGIPRASTPGAETKIDIPGIATVTLNGQNPASGGGIYQINVTALRVDVLKSNPLGIKPGAIVVGSSLASLHSPTNFRAAGQAYATQVDLAGVVSSGQTASVFVPCGGTNGTTKTNSTAALNVPGVISSGAVTSSARSVETSDGTSAILQSKVAGINLLGGAVTADAVTSKATATRSGDGSLSTSSDGTVITGLKILGETVTVGTDENTKIDVAGVGTLTLRKTVPASDGTDTIAMELTLNTDKAGLKSGTTIQVAVAKARVAR